MKDHEHLWEYDDDGHGHGWWFCTAGGCHQTRWFLPPPRWIATENLALVEYSRVDYG